MRLLTLTADGATDETRWGGAGVNGFSVIVTGTWGGGTASVQIQVNGSWVAVPGGTLTDDGTVFVEWPEAADWRVVLAGATTPSLFLIVPGTS